MIPSEQQETALASLPPSQHNQAAETHTRPQDPIPVRTRRRKRHPNSTQYSYVPTQSAIPKPHRPHQPSQKRKLHTPTQGHGAIALTTADRMRPASSHPQPRAQTRAQHAHRTSDPRSLRSPRRRAVRACSFGPCVVIRNRYLPACLPIIVRSENADSLDGRRAR